MSNDGRLAIICLDQLGKEEKIQPKSKNRQLIFWSILSLMKFFFFAGSMCQDGWADELYRVHGSPLIGSAAVAGTVAVVEKID